MNEWPSTKVNGKGWSVRRTSDGRELTKCWLVFSLDDGHEFEISFDYTGGDLSTKETGRRWELYGVAHQVVEFLAGRSFSGASARRPKEAKGAKVILSVGSSRPSSRSTSGRAREAFSSSTTRPSQKAFLVMSGRAVLELEGSD